jgi:hypothetical protein
MSLSAHNQSTLMSRKTLGSQLGWLEHNIGIFTPLLGLMVARPKSKRCGRPIGICRCRCSQSSANVSDRIRPRLCKNTDIVLKPAFLY